MATKTKKPRKARRATARKAKAKKPQKVKKTKLSLQWRRPKKDHPLFGKRTTWLSKCGQFKIEHHTERIGTLKDAFYALGLFGENFHILGIKSKRGTAEKLCIKEAIRREREFDAQRAAEEERKTKRKLKRKTKRKAAKRGT